MILPNHKQFNKSQEIAYISNVLIRFCQTKFRDYNVASSLYRAKCTFIWRCFKKLQNFEIDSSHEENWT